MARVSKGERVAIVSAILLLVSMFFDWFKVKSVYSSNLLGYFQSFEPGRNAWEALEYIPIALVATILATPTLVMVRAMGPVRKSAVALDALIALLGLGSALLILFRIISPPVFSSEPTVTREGVVQFPILLALLAAAMVAFGGYLSTREEGLCLADLRLALAKRLRAA